MTTIIKTSTNPPTIIVAISLTPSITTWEYVATVDVGAHFHMQDFVFRSFYFPGFVGNI